MSVATLSEDGHSIEIASTPNQQLTNLVVDDLISPGQHRSKTIQSGTAPRTIGTLPAGS